MNRILHTSGFLFLILFLFASCEKLSDTAVNPDYSSPLLLSVTLDRPVLNLDTDTIAAVPSAGNRYTVSLSASVRALRQASTGPFVATITVQKPGSITTAYRFSGTCTPNTGDTLDGIIPMTFMLERSQIGIVNFHCVLEPSTGTSSNEITQGLLVTRRNSRPVIGTISMPDSVTIGQIPSPDSSFLVTAAVSDSDGITDINPFGGVRFLSLKPDSTLANAGLPIYLFDDGNENILFLPDGRSGDALKGDGTFSFRVRLRAKARNLTPPPDSVDTQRGRYIFKFFAIDNSGASSDTVDKSITVQ